MANIPLYELKAVRRGTFRADSRSIHNQYDAALVVHEVLTHRDREAFVVMPIDTKNWIVGVHIVAIGALDNVSVHPREVFKFAVLKNAANIIVAHNHPSGDPIPSPADRALTRRLSEAGEILGIPLLDHLIIGERAEEVYSFQETAPQYLHSHAAER